MCLEGIILHAQSMITILGSIVNIIGGEDDLYARGEGHSIGILCIMCGGGVFV